VICCCTGPRTSLDIAYHDKDGSVLDPELVRVLKVSMREK